MGQRIEKRMKLNDRSRGISRIRTMYQNGIRGYPKDEKRAFELYVQAAELGSARAHNALAHAYRFSQGVEKDMEKAIHHSTLAAIGGHEWSRHNLGNVEKEKGNYIRAVLHYIMAAKAGVDAALKQVGGAYKAGGLGLTEDEYTTTLQATL